MRTSKAQTWITGTVALAVCILLAAWFLLISPVFAAASETEASAEAQDAQNAIEKQRIAKLSEDFANIETYRTELASLRQAIPTSPEHSRFQEQVAAMASAHGVTVASLTVTPSSEVLVDTSVAPAPAGAAAEGSDAAPEPRAANVGGFYQVPVAIELVGPYSNAMAFMAELQTINPRLFLVTALTGTALEEADPSGGLPATAAGDMNLVITGQMYVLVDPDAVPEALLGVEPSPMPVPAPGKNPMVPTP